MSISYSKSEAAELTAKECGQLPDPIKQFCYCKERLESDVDYDVDEVVHQIYPCPRTLEQARADTGRFIRQNHTSCYVSGKTFVVSNISFTQQCCYHSG